MALNQDILKWNAIQYIPLFEMQVRMWKYFQSGWYAIIRSALRDHKYEVKEMEQTDILNFKNAKGSSKKQNS